MCCKILAIVFLYLYNVGMYVATVPNRNSPPAILLRESFRLGGKVRNRTLSNLSHWPPAPLDALRSVLKGATFIGACRRLHLDRLIDTQASRELDLVVALIVARVLEPASKLATSRALHPDT